MANDGWARVERDSPVPPKLQPFALKDAPSLIEAVFPAQKDLEIFEKLMAFDVDGLARREPRISAAEIARRIGLSNPWSYFTASFKGEPGDEEEIEGAQFPLDVEQYPGLTVRWRRDIGQADKLDLLTRALANHPTYEERAGLCKRPEELDQDALYAPIWPSANAHLGYLGIEACSQPELVEQLGILRFGSVPSAIVQASSSASFPR